MLLSTLCETATTKAAVRAAMAEMPGFDEEDDYVIEEDGSISPAPDIGARELYIPPSWTQLKVKFNAFPTLTLKAVKSKLQTLANMPPTVKMLHLYQCSALANLMHGPKGGHRGCQSC